MANSFASRNDCFGHWRFESGALATDTKGLNTLNLSGTPTEDTTNQMEGSCCISLNAATPQYCYITDANLSANFPFKSGDTNKIITINCWVRPTTVDTNKRRIWSKFTTSSGGRSLQLYHNSTQIYFVYGTSNGFTSTEVSLAFGAMTANQKYFISLSIDGPALVWRVRIFNVTAGTWYTNSGTLTNAPPATAADFRIGADDQLAANTSFNGQIDEVSVFNSWLHNQQVLDIKAATFPSLSGTYSAFDYAIDSVNGNDSNDGLTWATAFKTLKKSFRPNEVINIIKNVETAQAGTCGCTQGNNVVTTTNDLSAALPQYTFIRFDTDVMPYMVKAVSSNSITLYRPYRGTTGAAKTVYKLTLPTTASYDYNPTSCTGVYGKEIHINGGINSSTNEQDGLTVINGNGGTYGPGQFAWAIVSRLYSYYHAYGWRGLWDCTLTDVGTFRNSLNGLANDGWTRVVGTNISVAESSFPGGTGFSIGCNITNLDIGRTGGAANAFTLGKTVDSIFNGVKVPCWGNINSVNFGGSIWGVRIIDFDGSETVTGGGTPNNAIFVGADSFLDDVVFINPLFNAATNFFGESAIALCGELNFKNINKKDGDDLTIVGSGTSANTNISLISKGTQTYRTTSPSVKIRLGLGNGSPVTPFYTRHVFPCDAGVPRTISAYLRKNSSPVAYNGITIANGGSGYALNDIITLVQTNAGGCQAKVSAVSGGVVTGLSFICGGYNYSIANGLTTSNIYGSGTGLTVNVTILAAGYGLASENLNPAAWVQPFMRLKWYTGTAPDLVLNTHDVAMDDTPDTWNLVSYQVTSSITGVIVAEFFFNSPNGHAIAWYDDIGVA